MVSIRNGEIGTKKFFLRQKGEQKKIKKKNLCLWRQPKQQFLQIWLKYEGTYFANSIFVSTSLSRYKTISFCRMSMPCIIKSKCQYFIKHFNKCLSNTKSCYHSRNVRNKRLKKNPVRLMDAPSPVTLYQMRRVRILQPCGGHFFVQAKRTFLTSEWTRTQLDSVNFNPLKRPFTRYLLRSKHPSTPLQKQGYGSSFYCYHKKANCNNLKCCAMKLVPWKLNRKLLLFPIVWGWNSVLYDVGHFDLRPFALQKLAILKLVINFNQILLCT